MSDSETKTEINSATAEIIGNMIRKIEEITSRRVEVFEMDAPSKFRLQMGGNTFPIPPKPKTT